jgi:hypothetical protein
MLALLTLLIAVVLIGGPVLFFTNRGSRAAAIARWFRATGPWLVPALAMVIVTSILTLAGGLGGFVAAFVLAAIVLFAANWLREFRCLMSMADDCFPGRNDKLVWAILMIFLPPVGVIAFWSFRRAYWATEKPSAAELRHELG